MRRGTAIADTSTTVRTLNDACGGGREETNSHTWWEVAVLMAWLYIREKGTSRARRHGG